MTWRSPLPYKLSLLQPVCTPGQTSQNIRRGSSPFRGWGAWSLLIFFVLNFITLHFSVFNLILSVVSCHSLLLCWLPTFRNYLSLWRTLSFFLSCSLTFTLLLPFSLSISASCSPESRAGKLNLSGGFAQYKHDTHLEDARFLTRNKNQPCDWRRSIHLLVFPATSLLLLLLFTFSILLSAFCCFVVGAP